MKELARILKAEIALPLWAWIAVMMVSVILSEHGANALRWLFGVTFG